MMGRNIGLAAHRLPKTAVALAFAIVALSANPIAASKTSPPMEAVIVATRDCVAATSMRSVDKAALQAREWQVMFASEDDSEHIWMRSEKNDHEYPGIIAPRRVKGGVACVVRGRIENELFFGEMMFALNAEFAVVASTPAGIAFQTDKHSVTPALFKDNGKPVYEITIRENGETN